MPVGNTLFLLTLLALDAIAVGRVITVEELAEEWPDLNPQPVPEGVVPILMRELSVIPGRLTEAQVDRIASLLGATVDFNEKFAVVLRNTGGPEVSSSQLSLQAIAALLGNPTGRPVPSDVQPYLGLVLAWLYFGEFREGYFVEVVGVQGPEVTLPEAVV